MSKRAPFPDRSQNFWHLTCIQGAGQSVPSMLVGGVIAKSIGAGGALIAVCIGNLILWLIGLGVISMAAKERKDAVENVRGYLGRGTSLFMAVLVTLSFLAWFMLELQSSTTMITSTFHADEGWIFVFTGAVFGIFLSWISRKGIKLIKRVCVFGFPVMLAFVVLEITYSGFSVFYETSWSFSFKNCMVIAAITLPGFINLPTFFRHSRSQPDSIIALTLITIFDMIFEMLGVFTNTSTHQELLANVNPLLGELGYSAAVLIVILISLVSLNLVNIYFGSVGLLAIFPKLSPANSYLIIGLVGTVTFVFLQNLAPMFVLENIAVNFTACLGVVLLISYLVSVNVKHRPRVYEKLVNSACWLFGCIVALILQFAFPNDSIKALIGSVASTIIAFMGVMFFEETLWAYRSLKKGGD